MIVAIGDVSGSQRRVRRQLGMSEGYLAGRAGVIPTRRGELLAARRLQRSGVTASVIGYGLAGTPAPPAPAQLIDGAGMVPRGS